jgi:2-methylcitrate dehydratase PrpD
VPSPESQSLTQKLIELIDRKPIVAADRQMTTLFVLDAIACAIGARSSQQGNIFSKLYSQGGQDAGRQALTLGALIHTLEIDDLHRASVVHPGCVVIPAAWAVARREKANGLAFLDAVLRGFEAACRVGMSVGPAHYEVWHNTATCGPFGAAMAAASLIDLTPAQTSDALGNAGTQSSGLWEFLPAGAMSKHLHAGRAAESGIMAADLAKLGLTGPATILEGEKGFYKGLCPNPQPEALYTGADQPWQMHATSMKPWPSCRHTHPAIDAALELGPQVQGATIESVLVETYQAAVNVCDRPLPTTDYDAKFSLQHCVAAALTLPEIGFSSFDEHARNKLAPLATKVTLRVCDPYDASYPESWGAQLTVTLSNDETISTRRHFAKGDPQDRLTVDDVIAKAAGLMKKGGINSPEPLIEQIMNLSQASSLPDLPLVGFDG